MAHRARSARAVLAGFLMAALIGGGAAYENLMISGSTLNFDYSSGAALFTFSLFVLVVNPVLRLLRRSWAFERGELATLFIMALVACAVPTIGLIGLLIPAISGGTYYATPENGWLEVVLPNIEPRLLVTDPDAVKGFYEGRSAGAVLPWRLWIGPLLAWLPLIAGFFAAVIGLMALLRRQWIVNERLVFPLVQVPIAMIGEPGHEGGALAPIFRRMPFWAGALIPAFFYSWRALHNYYPFIPEGIPLWTFAEFGEGSVVIPWTLNYAGVGFGFLLTAKLSFSIWFMGALTIAEEVLLTRLGMVSGERIQWNTSPSIYPNYQGFGAMLMFALLVLWGARHHLHLALARAWRGEASGDESEVLSYRGAALLLAGGLACVMAWLWASGLDLWVGALLVAVAFLLMLALARIVAEGGLAVSIAPLIPSDAVISMVGGATLGSTNLSSLGLTLPVASHMRTSLMSSVAHGLKLAEMHLPANRGLVWPIAGAIAISAAGAIAVMLVLGYAHGGVNLSEWFFGPTSGGLMYEYIAYHINWATGPRWESLGFAGAGALVQWLLTLAHQRLYWWPLHPLSFPIGAIWCTHQVMVSMFIAWAAKSTILHYGGVRSYEAAKPLFLGLILGQYLSGGVWLLIDGCTGMRGNYLFYW